MSKSSRTRDAGCMFLLGASMNRWCWARALCAMNSSPPLTAIPCCPSGAQSLATSSRWRSNSAALLTRRRAVPMDVGRFFFRSLVSLCSAVKYCDPKFSVAVGDSSLFVVMSRILMNVSRCVYESSSCRLFFVSAHARIKSVLRVNGPGAVFCVLQCTDGGVSVDGVSFGALVC